MRPVWFKSFVEGLYLRGLRKDLTQDHRARLLEVGINLGRLETSYSAETFEAGLREVATVLRPTGTWHEQSWALGERAIIGYFDTMIGHALATALRLVGPAPSVPRLNHSFRSLANYVSFVVLESGDGVARVRVDQAGELGSFVIATLHGSAQLFSGKKARAEYEGTEGGSSFAKLSW